MIIERKNDGYHALIPELSGLKAEGASADEAVRNVQQAAEAYLATVELRTIHLSSPPRYSTAQDLLKAIGSFSPFDELDRQHLAEIDAERKRQYEEANREADAAESE